MASGGHTITTSLKILFQMFTTCEQNPMRMSSEMLSNGGGHTMIRIIFVNYYLWNFFEFRRIRRWFVTQISLSVLKLRVQCVMRKNRFVQNILFMCVYVRANVWLKCENLDWMLAYYKFCAYLEWNMTMLNVSQMSKLKQCVGLLKLV